MTTANPFPTADITERRERFRFLLAHLPQIADGLAAFTDDTLRAAAFHRLLDTLTADVELDVDLDGDVDGGDVLLRSELRRLEERNAALEDELGKLGDFLIRRYAGAYPQTGSVIDSAIHVMGERWSGPSDTDVRMLRLSSWLADNMPAAELRGHEDAVDTAIRLLSGHLACPSRVTTPVVGTFHDRQAPTTNDGRHRPPTDPRMQCIGGA